ncbi:MAG: hypothetical protein EU521_00240 [Promethearchaeota archaeon]|nr:MAG: hypothetical protein EU521_00240 [Candidatus Lokiarchaeota archaeon]
MAEDRSDSSENNEDQEPDYSIDFITSSAISRVNIKFLLVYIPIIWFSGILVGIYWYTFTILKTPLDWTVFFLILPAHIMAMFLIFIFGCMIISKLILILINLVHRPKEGIFKAELGDTDFEFWCLRIEIKKLVLWLLNNSPVPWMDVIAYKWFGINIDFSSHLNDAWCDIEFVNFGRRVMIGQGAVVLSSMVVGKYLIIKKVIFEDYALVGGQSTVAPGTIVGRDTVLGACLNTAFNQFCEPGWVYAGIPARKLKKNKYAEERRDIIVKTDVDEEEQYEVESEVNIDEDKKDMV